MLKILGSYNFPLPPSLTRAVYLRIRILETDSGILPDPVLVLIIRFKTFLRLLLIQRQLSFNQGFVQIQIQILKCLDPDRDFS